MASEELKRSCVRTWATADWIMLMSWSPGQPWSFVKYEISFAVLGSGSLECGSHSLYYFLDQHRMLINVSEGVQRLACQYRLKIAPTKLSAIFLTRLDWECFGGLPGLILTMGDTARLINDSSSAKPLKIIGPKGLAHAIAAMRPFLHRRDFAVDVTELCVEEDISHWRDERADVDFELNCWRNVAEKVSPLKRQRFECWECWMHRGGTSSFPFFACSNQNILFHWGNGPPRTLSRVRWPSF